MARKFIGFLSIVIFAFGILLAPSASFGSQHGGEGGSSQSAAETKAVENLISVFTSKGVLEGKDLQKALDLSKTGLAEGKCKATYMAGASLLRSGEYDRGRDLLLKTLDGCYDVSVKLWGDDMEKLRTLAAGELALHAGDKGDFETILIVEKKLEKDLPTDRLLVRDAKGILASRTKLAEVLRFHKARAYSASGKVAEAKSTLKELQFASGKVFVNGEVTGLKDAIAKLKIEVDGKAFLPFLKAV